HSAACARFTCRTCPASPFLPPAGGDETTVSGAVHQPMDAARASAMRAAVHHLVDFQAVPDDAAAAGRAAGCEALNRAFERIEVVRPAILRDAQAPVIVVAACVADCH